VTNLLNLSEASLDWSLAHVLKEGDTDVFPIPFEFDAIKFNWKEVRDELRSVDVLDWATRPCRSMLSPKAKFGFRIVTQLDPLDFLIYTALIYDVCHELELKRIPVSEGRVFSYRISPTRDGELFDSDVNYRAFLEQCRAKVSQKSSSSVVATTDISDFYSRIYHHRLDNALRGSVSRASHVTAIMRLLKGWNNTETFGIPVGCAASRVLAEITLSDVDEALLAYEIDFVRYNDDYRIFADTAAKAYKQLAFLAETLFANHGLSLQQQKTSIYSIDQFSSQFLEAPVDRVVDSLREKYYDLLEGLGITDPYEPIFYEDLTDEQQEALDALNLVEIFKEESASSEPDLALIRFCLRHLGQLGDDGVVDAIFENLDSIIPTFMHIVKYFSVLRGLSSLERTQLGARLLDLGRDSIVSELPYHRMWIFEPFAQTLEWKNGERLARIYEQERDQACRRQLVLAMGRAKHQHWFQSQWRRLFEHPHWERRAVLAAASILPADSRRHWYKSLNSRLDLLERTVIKWANSGAFTSV